MVVERRHSFLDKMVSLFFDNELLSEDGESVEETFTDYVGITLSDSEAENDNADPLWTDNTSFSGDSNNSGQISRQKTL